VKEGAAVVAYMWVAPSRSGRRGSMNRRDLKMDEEPVQRSKTAPCGWHAPTACRESLNGTIGLGDNVDSRHKAGHGRACTATGRTGTEMEKKTLVIGVEWWVEDERGQGRSESMETVMQTPLGSCRAKKLNLAASDPSIPGADRENTTQTQNHKDPHKSSWS
jgi:hypothetical protein